MCSDRQEPKKKEAISSRIVDWLWI